MVIDEVHEAGGRIAPQLWHVGQKRTKANIDGSLGPDYESPSGLSASGEPVARPMSKADESIQGRDRQLETAVDMLNRALERHPTVLPPAPPALPAYSTRGQVPGPGF
jgi:hypothetical protein